MGFKETEEFINKLRLIVYGLLAIPLIVFVVFYLRTDKGENIVPLVSENLIDPVAAIIVVLGLALIVYAYYTFTKRIRPIREEQKLSEKFNGYYNATVLKFSLFEAALILSIAGLFITGLQLFVAKFVLVIFVFSVENPSLRKTLHHLRLSKLEKEQLLKHGKE
jgi:uncharacterized membrane protein YidH (DUF202 family)